jgi:hypothetical protein
MEDIEYLCFRNLIILTIGSILLCFATYVDVKEAKRRYYSEENKCLECNETIDEPYYYKIDTPCKHQFHRRCLGNYMTFRNKSMITCPVCENEFEIQLSGTYYIK